MDIQLIYMWINHFYLFRLWINLDWANAVSMLRTRHPGEVHWNLVNWDDEKSFPFQKLYGGNAVAFVNFAAETSVNKFFSFRWIRNNFGVFFHVSHNEVEFFLWIFLRFLIFRETITEIWSIYFAKKNVCSRILFRRWILCLE